MDSSETAQSAQWGGWRLWKSQINLCDFITLSLAGVPHIRIYPERITGLQRGARELQIAVLEFRVTKSITERVQRLASKIAVSPVLHGIVFKGRQLVDALVKSHGQ